jgi:hypothetical protein
LPFPSLVNQLADADDDAEDQHPGNQDRGGDATAAAGR